MADVRADGTAVPELSEFAVQIVLFGMPDAGKSSLLGALAQAADLQRPALSGDLQDLTGGLAELQQQVYESTPRQTPQEIVPYPVRIAMQTGEQPPLTIDALLIDCDGRVANEFLTQQRELLVKGRRNGELARSVLGADTLVLVVDVSSRQPEIQRDFTQFAKFLRILEHSRSQRSDINGLPVYLVLTKCDLLARPEDTPTAWMDRIEERKRVIDQRFRDFLAQQTAREQQPFGKIALHLWATAIKRPALGKLAEKPKEPYGVGELFRQAFQSAYQFQQQSSQAQRRLRWTVGSAIGLVAVMAVLGALFFLTRPDPEVTQLENKVDAYLAQKLKPADIYKTPAEDIEQLEAFRQQPEFAHLNPQTRQAVTARTQKLQAYQEFQQQMAGLQQKYGAPSDIDSEERLQELADQLKKLQPPEQYRPEWEQSRIEQVRLHWLKQVQAIEKAVTETQQEYGRLKQLSLEIQKLSLSGKIAEAVEKAKAAVPLADKLNTQAKNLDDWVDAGKSIAWSTIYNYPSVGDLREDWAIMQAQINPYLEIARAARKQ